MCKVPREGALSGDKQSSAPPVQPSGALSCKKTALGRCAPSGRLFLHSSAPSGCTGGTEIAISSPPPQNSATTLLFPTHHTFPSSPLTPPQLSQPQPQLQNIFARAVMHHVSSLVNTPRKKGKETNTSLETAINILEKEVSHVWAKTTTRSRQLLFARLFQWCQHNNISPYSPDSAILFVIATRVSLQAQLGYTNALSGIFKATGFPNRPLLTYAASLRARGAAIPISQATPISKATLITWAFQRSTPADVRLCALLAWKTASRWGDIYPLSQEQFLLIEDNEVIIDWNRTPKGRRANPFTTSKWTVIRGHLTSYIAKCLKKKNKFTKICQLDAQGLVRLWKQDNKQTHPPPIHFPTHTTSLTNPHNPILPPTPTSHPHPSNMAQYTAHSIKRGALSHLIQKNSTRPSRHPRSLVSQSGKAQDDSRSTGHHDSLWRGSNRCSTCDEDRRSHKALITSPQTSLSSPSPCTHTITHSSLNRYIHSSQFPYPFPTHPSQPPFSRKASITRRAHTTRLPQTEEEKAAPLHVTEIAPLHVDSLIQRLLPNAHARFQQVWRYIFSPKIQSPPRKYHNTSNFSLAHALQLVKNNVAGKAPGPGSVFNIPFTVLEEKPDGPRQRFILWTIEGNENLKTEGYTAEVPLQHVSKYLEVVNDSCATT